MRELLLGFCLIISLFSLPLSADEEQKREPQVYVALGMHTSFYHSWRGDTNDDAGFGFDIRVVREILKDLKEAHENGQEAMVYWDWTIHWTVEQWLEKYAPDIITDIKERVDKGLDEIVLGPYNNGFNTAGNKEEFLKGIEWSIENPWGSGLKQIFGQYAPVYRPQEMVYTPGQNALMKEAGVEALILYYASTSFNSFSSFIPALDMEKRFNPIEFRSSPDDTPITVLPAIGHGDLQNYTSMEALILRLRKLQQRGEIKNDVIINVNFDADAETWVESVGGFLGKIIPNAGGIVEYIKAVNKYEWAHFTTPHKYLKDHKPLSSVVVSQDLADGAFDGMSSWAEKESASTIWTNIAKTRIIDRQSKALSRQRPALKKENEDDFNFNRFLTMSTTHFGMVTPVLNLQRRKQAWNYSLKALDHSMERLNAKFEELELTKSDDVCFNFTHSVDSDLHKVRLKLPVANNYSYKSQNENVRSYYLSRKPLTDKDDLEEILLFVPKNTESLCLNRVERKELEVQHVRSKQNLELGSHKLTISKKGLRSWEFKGEKIGGKKFIRNRIRYGGGWKKPYETKVQIEKHPYSDSEVIRITKFLTTKSRKELKKGAVSYLMIPLDDQLLFEVEVDYPKTPETKIPGHANQVSFLKKIDKKWKQVAPFQITPYFRGTVDEPFTVVKKNELGVQSSYEFNYGTFSRNKDLDSSNNHLTPSWVAVSNKKQGLLIANDNMLRANFAFAPMRLDQSGKKQKLMINPYGTYFGDQFDYKGHLGVKSIGQTITDVFAPHVKPNAPGHNGKFYRYSLLMSPYNGVEPPESLIRSSEDFSFEGLIQFTKSPYPGIRHQHDLVDWVALLEKERDKREKTGPLSVPANITAIPIDDKALEIFWEKQLYDPRISSYLLQYRKKEDREWSEVRIYHRKENNHLVEGLVKDEIYVIRMKSIAFVNGKEVYSEWSEKSEIKLSSESKEGFLSLSILTRPKLVFQFLGNIFSHVFKTKF